MQGYLGVKPGWTRISFPYYMSNDEFEFILTALEFIAIYGQRFLPLYHFNLRSGSWTFKRRSLQDLRDKGMNIGHDQSKDGNNAEKHDKFVKFSDYLETAERIANLLPKFPPQRRLPEDIDINFLHFRV